VRAAAKAERGSCPVAGGASALKQSKGGRNEVDFPHLSRGGGMAKIFSKKNGNGENKPVFFWLKKKTKKEYS